MKRAVIAGMAAVVMLAAKSTVMGAELTGSCYGAGIWHDGCLRYASSSVRLENRHHCVDADAAWDVSCHDIDWHYGQHHGEDGNTYCAEHGCAYADCLYEHETGYCTGGGCWTNANAGNGSYGNSSSGNGSSGNESYGNGSGNDGYGNGSSESDSYENGNYGNGTSGYGQNGYQGGGSGHHGSGHHGRGHH